MAGGSAGRVAALTGLRGLAAASVLFYHVWLYGAPGADRFPSGPLVRVFVNLEFGVTFFFVLSGSLLYRSYARALLAGDPLPRLSHFVIARVLRIVPTYWAILLLVMALTERHLFSQPWPLLANLFFLEFWIPSFFPDNLGVANGSMAIVPSWSLAVEAGFYLSLPLLAVLALWFARRTGRRVAAAFVPPIALTVLGLAAIVVEHVLSGNLRRAWALGFPIHAGWFACGMAGATLGFLIEQKRLRLPAHWRSVAVVAALGLTAGSIKLHNIGVFSRVDYQWPVAIALSLLLLLIVFAEDGGRLRTVLGSRLLVAMGLASYSIFLVHDPVIRELRTHDFISSGVDGFLLTLLLVGGATAIAATVSYQLLERPCFALKRRLTRPASENPARAARPGLVPPGSGRRGWLTRRRDRTLSAVLERLVVDVDPARAEGFVIEATAGAEVRVDTVALEPVVAPLLRNALAYGRPPYVIRASRHDGRLELAIEDRGRGVDERFAPRLFEPFARSEPSRQVPGRGLGLALARKSARELGGNIVYCPTDGPGAHFAITLPLDPVPPREAHRPDRALMLSAV